MSPKQRWVHSRFSEKEEGPEKAYACLDVQYGTKAWDDHWSLLTGDGELIWGPDPSLTSVGEGQARDARRIWNNLLSEGAPDPPPLPGAYFSSPMIRSAKTLYLTFEGRTPAKPFVILESIREDFKDRHTCDERSKRSDVAAEWEPKGWIIDSKMEEEDTLFKSDYKETHETMAKRLADALSDIFERTEGIDVINITSHSGVMQALFRAVDHDDFKPKTGGESGIVLAVWARTRSHARVVEPLQGWYRSLSRALVGPTNKRR